MKWAPDIPHLLLTTGKRDRSSDIFWGVATHLLCLWWSEGIWEGPTGPDCPPGEGGEKSRRSHWWPAGETCCLTRQWGSVPPRGKWRLEGMQSDDVHV